MSLNTPHTHHTADIGHHGLSDHRSNLAWLGALAVVIVAIVAAFALMRGNGAGSFSPTASSPTSEMASMFDNGSPGDSERAAKPLATPPAPGDGYSDMGSPSDFTAN